MRLVISGLGLLLACPVEAADFRVMAGHGGPVMGIAVSEAGSHALTASFDNSVGYWTLGGDKVVWLEAHEAAVKAVTFIDETRAASAGDDFAITLWDLTSGTEIARLTGHQGQIQGLAVSPDGAMLASAGWDGWIGLWDIASGEALGMLKGHESAVNDVVFSADGTRLYSASADGTIRVWDVAAQSEVRLLTRHGFGVTRLLRGDGWLAYGAVDGGTRVIDPESGDTLADLTLERRPILSLALSPDESEMSVGDGEGFVMSVATEGWRIISDYRVAANGPVWALAYTGDGESLITGGIDDAAFVWPVDNALDAPIMATAKRSFQELPDTMSNGERQFQRKCSICHSLADDGVRRAGPTLAGLFGRAAGSLPDYTYSDTVATLGIDWTDETIDQLFDLGPDHFIPGSKMPMQRITDPADRQDLIDFLRENT